MRNLIIILLVVTFGLNAQVTNPTKFEKIKITNNLVDTTAPNIIMQSTDGQLNKLSRAAFTDDIIAQIPVSTITVSQSLLTYTNTATFTLPQNKKVVSVVIGGLLTLKTNQYTYNQSAATNNFVITDATVLSSLESGTSVIITLI